MLNAGTVEGAIGIALAPVAAGAASAAEESRTAIVAHRSLDEWISLMESVTAPAELQLNVRREETSRSWTRGMPPNSRV
jgi:hypothetical protein